jgi:hypothetical protein
MVVTVRMAARRRAGPARQCASSSLSLQTVQVVTLIMTPGRPGRRRRAAGAGPALAALRVRRRLL